MRVPFMRRKQGKKRPKRGIASTPQVNGKYKQKQVRKREKERKRERDRERERERER